MTVYRFSKYDRLTKRIYIRMLFERGSTFFYYPFKVFYIIKKQEPGGGHKVLFTVPKKRVNAAVHRNRIKRLARESYRINKYILDIAAAESQYKFVFLIGYVYTGNSGEVCYPVVNRAVVESLHYFKNLLHTVSVAERKLEV